MAATPDPMASTRGSMKGVPNPSPPPAQIFTIAGIKCHVYGLESLPANGAVAVLWLLHPRLSKAESMAPVAGACMNAWTSHAAKTGKGLLCVAFDQRNHGTRLVDPSANEAWKQGGKRHAIDMFSVYHGTATDVSQLIDFLPAYLFPRGERAVVQHLVLGVSLGGHAAWHVLLHEPRCSAAVVVIGCPDYTSLMTDRARLSKLPSWSRTNGKGWVGCEDFPPALAEEVARWDPAGFFGRVSGSQQWDREPLPAEKEKLVPIMQHCLAGKRVLCLSGGKDKLVPYARGAPVLAWLKAAIGDGGWFGGRGTVVEDTIDPEAGHEFTEMMRHEAVRFVCDVLSSGAGPGSKM